MRTLFLITLLLLPLAPVTAQAVPDWEGLETLRDSGKLAEALELLESWPHSSFTGTDRVRFLAGRQQLLHGLRRYPEAQRAGRPWIEWARQASDLPEEARACYHVGRSFAAQDHHPQAAQHYLAAMEAVRATDDRQLELRILLGLSFARISMAQYREAKTLLQRGDWLWKDLGEQPQTGTVLWQRKGTLQLNLGNHRGAVPLLQRALALARETGAGTHISTALTNLAQAHMRLNNWVEAIDLLKEVLEQSQEPRPVALATLAICHFELNQFDQARQAFEQVRELGRAQGRLALEAWATAELGIVAGQADQDFDKALSLYDQGIEMFRQARSFNNEAAFIENKGHVYRDQGRYQEALLQYDEAENKRRSLGLPSGPALLKGRGQCLVGLGRVKEAIAHFQQALEAADLEGDDKRIWQTHWEMAKSLRAQEQLEQADRAFELAIDQIEASRRDLRLGAFKTDFFQDKVKVYEQYVDLLVVQLRAPERAFQIAERARARSFLDSLAEVRADLHGTLPRELLEKEEVILDGISLLQAEIRSGETPPELQEELSQKEQELQGLYLDLRTEYPAFFAFRYPEPANLRSVQDRLGDSELLAQYFVGAQHSHLWLVSREGAEHHLLPGRQELGAVVKQAYRSLLDPDRPPTGLEELSSLLLPDGDQWVSDHDIVTIVPSGLLYYFPFEVLTRGERTLGEMVQTAYLPSASAISYLRDIPERDISSPRLLALGDADYSGSLEAERSASLRGLQALGSLPFTRAKVAAIRSIFGYFNSTLLLGERATETRLKDWSYPTFRFCTWRLMAGSILCCLPARASCWVWKRAMKRTGFCRRGRCFVFL